jgi:hypothetical protein
MANYEPRVGDMATVNLPGEVTRGEIVRVINPQSIIVKLTVFTTSKDHDYRRFNMVPCRLKKDFANRLVWESIPEGELKASAEREEAKRAAAAEVPDFPTQGLAPDTGIAKPPDDGFVLSEN